MKSFQAYLIAALLATTAVTSVIAWNQHQELVGLRAAAMSPEERTDLQKRVWDAQKRAERAEAQAAAIHSSVADSLGSPAAAGEEAGGDQQSRVIGNMVNTWIGMMNDPEAQRLMALQQKAGISSRYAELFKKLHLPPDKLEQFKAELLEKQTSRNDALLAAAQQGINPMQNPKEFQQLQERIQSDIDKQIKTTIGDDAYAQYDQYQNDQRSQGPRSVINQLRQSLSYTESPLTQPQADQMAQILATTGPLKSGPDGIVQPSKNNTRVTEETITQAQMVLAPTQVRALQEIQQQQSAGEQLQKLMRENRSNNPTAGLSGG
jgi:hypothetical protein